MGCCRCCGLFVFAMDLSYFEKQTFVVLEMFSYHIDNGGLITKESPKKKDLMLPLWPLCL